MPAVSTGTHSVCSRPLSLPLMPTLRRLLAPIVFVCAAAVGACSGESTAPDTPAGATPATPVTPASTVPVQVAAPNPSLAAVVSEPFVYDASRSGAAFTDPRRTGLAYAVSFAPSSNGFTATNGRITGTPVAPAMTTVTITARDSSGSSASQSFVIVTFASDLTTPTLPVTLLAYSDARVPLPRHYAQAPPNAPSPIAADNTPSTNPTTDAGATLGRVLFYDRRLSVNDRVSCASCHQQQFAFSDSAQLSRGFAGARTGRHSMGLANARFYDRGRFFWDERAATLEAQVLQPVQDATEMGLTLDQLRTKLSLTPYYAALFSAAFGTADITTERVALALSQFVRSMVSVNSKFDRAFAANGMPNFPATFTAEELAGQMLFNGRAGCARCHGTNAHISDDIHNTGLDATETDAGAGRGRFKAPSLRNVAVRAPYMHDGRFRTLNDVIAFYDAGVRANPDLDPRLRAGNGQPLRLNLSAVERTALAAFLNTLTDVTFLQDPRLSSPFPR